MTDDYKQGLINGLAMQPLYVTTSAEKASGNVAEKLQTSGSEYYARTSSSGFDVCQEGSEQYEERICRIQANPDSKTALIIGDTGGNDIQFLQNNAGFRIESRSNSLTVDENGSSVLFFYSNGTYFNINPGSSVELNNNGIKIYSKKLGAPITIKVQEDGLLHIKAGNLDLKMAYDGLYYNDKKVLTE